MLDTSAIPRRGTSAPFRFDAGPHHYITVDDGVVRPHITGMLKRCGYVDDRWFTEESRLRGTRVHRLSEQYELGLIDPKKVRGKYRGWFLSYLDFVAVVRPLWVSIEERIVHPEFQFGGTLDRLGVIYGERSIVDLKSGVKMRSHAIQTALQAVLAEAVYGVPAAEWNRFSCYLRADGRWSLEQFENRNDVHEAMGVIAACC